MSWQNRTFLTEMEARRRNEVPTTQFNPGDVVKMKLGDPTSETDGDIWVKGIVTGARFDADAIFYTVAFKIEGADVYINVPNIRSHMVRIQDGEETEFFKKEEVEELVKKLPPDLHLVGD